ncbi:MAG: LOG family protein [Bacteroidota bacterium]
MSDRKIITIFGSSRQQEGDAGYARAYELGRELAKAGFDVCNGGYRGTMEAAARGARENGGSTIGITTTFFPRPANDWIEHEVRMPTMIDRLMKLVEAGDGYVVLKGGTGTLLEFAAVWEFINKGMLPERPIVVLDDFWDPVIGTLRPELEWEGIGDCTRFVKQAHSVEECVEYLQKRLLPGS